MNPVGKRFSISTLTEQKVVLLVRDTNGAPLDASELNMSLEVFTRKGAAVHVEISGGACDGAVIEDGLIVIQPESRFEPGVLKVAYRLQADNGNVIYNICDTNIDVLPSTASIGDMQGCVYTDIYIEEICRDASYSPGSGGGGGGSVADVLNTLLRGFDVDSGSGKITSNTSVLKAFEILARSVGNGSSRIVPCDDGMILLCGNEDKSLPSCNGIRIISSESGNSIRIGDGQFALLSKTDEEIKTVSEEWDVFSPGSGGSATTDVLATKLSGLDLSLKGTTVSQSLSVLQAFGVIFGRLNDGKKMRVALSSSGIIMGFENRGTEDSRISTLVLLDLESSKIYWKSNASYDITMMSDADEIESLLKSGGGVINLGGGSGSTDVLGTTAKAGGYQAKQTVEESDDIESVLSSLTAFSNNGRFSINSDDTGMLIVSRNADTGGTNVGLRLLKKEDGSIELRGTVTTNGVLVHRLCNTQGNAGNFVSNVMETSKSWPLIMSNSGSSITVDSSLSDTSTNPVQNKAVKAALDGKQDKLVSGENIKTVNGQSILGKGEIRIENPDVLGKPLDGFNETSASGSIKTTTTILGAIEILARCVENGLFRAIVGNDSIILLGIGGTSVSPKTIGLRFDISTKKMKMGSGTATLFDDTDDNIAGASASWPECFTVDSSLSSSSENPVQNKVVKSALDAKQDKLVSGENIKTLNGMSLLGEGDIVADGVELYEVHNAFPENLEIMPGKIYSVPSSGGMVQSVSLTVKKYTLSSSTGQQNLKKLETKLYVSDYYNMNFTAEAGLALYKSDYGQPPQNGGIRVFTINWIQSGLEQYAVLNCMDLNT